MKHKASNNFIGYLLVTLCCMMIIPSVVYGQTAESDVGVLHIEQEKYILERTGTILVKIFGHVELDWNPPKVLLTHTIPNGESLTHHLLTNDEGYFEFYFVHDWESTRGNYDVYVSTSNHPYTSQIDIGTVSYELIRDQTYDSDQKVKDEYWKNMENKIETMETVKGAIDIYEKNWDKGPLWVKNIVDWYHMDRIDGDEVINAIQYLVKNDIIKIN